MKWPWFCQILYQINNLQIPICWPQNCVHRKMARKVSHLGGFSDFHQNVAINTFLCKFWNRTQIHSRKPYRACNILPCLTSEHLQWVRFMHVVQFHNGIKTRAGLICNSKLYFAKWENNCKGCYGISIWWRCPNALPNVRKLLCRPPFPWKQDLILK